MAAAGWVAGRSAPGRAAGREAVLGVHERACCPVAAPQAARFDDVLLPVLQAAGFTVTDAGYRPTRGGQAFLCHALRPAGP